MSKMRKTDEHGYLREPYIITGIDQAIFHHRISLCEHAALIVAAAKGIEGFRDVVSNISLSLS